MNPRTPEPPNLRTISILVPDLSAPSLGAAVMLAQRLEPVFQVEVVGSDFGHGVCGMYYHSREYKKVSAPHLYRLPDYLWESRRLMDAVSGEVVIAVKAYANTLPIALRLKKRRGCKVVVYLDELDSAPCREQSFGMKTARWMRNWHRPMDDVYFPLVESLIPKADLVVSSSSFLLKRFGGEVIPIGVDTQIFKPAIGEQRQRLRDELGLADRKIIVFGGVVRPHKGVEDLCEAIAQLADPELALLVVGPETEHLRRLMCDSRFGKLIRCTGNISKEKMPSYIDTADLVVLPQTDTLLARSQVPCKVFEAMAMAKPIIASDVSDLSEILNGCGWIVPPGKPGDLAAAIREVLDHPDTARERGAAAREKCVREYDAAVTARRLCDCVGLVRNTRGAEFWSSEVLEF